MTDEERASTILEASPMLLVALHELACDLVRHGKEERHRVRQMQTLKKLRFLAEALGLGSRSEG